MTTEARPARREWVAVVLAAVALFAVRIPFLPSTFGDIDSINFDLGVHDYDPVAHHPHPPGYPVFILLAKLAHPLFGSHAYQSGGPAAYTRSLERRAGSSDL